MTVEEDAAIVEKINGAKPDILWVALGMPKQGWWIYQHLNTLRVPVVAGIGAAFRFLGGDVKRAPAWVGDHGFEWLWRLASEPRKLWRRDLIDGPRFLAYALAEILRTRRSIGSASHLPMQPIRTCTSPLNLQPKSAPAARSATERIFIPAR
jgi:N-acetylglucosaminyldiphosphoundecaprenol N-acetyl-beta-D-mannosaminyltransferase